MAAINTFNRIVYFGDSLTDSGAVFDISDDFLTIPSPPEALGYAQQFSDGEVYADVAARLLGAPVENFAVGGARAVGVIPAAVFVPDEASFPDGFNGFTAPPPLSDLLAFDINVSGQVDRFVTQSSFSPGTAASILIGLNDLNNFTPTSADPDIVVQQALGLSGQILFETVSAGFQLAGAGVQTIVFNTLPGVTFTPSTAFASPDVIALGESIIPLYNFNLGLSAQVLQGAGIDARIVDLNYIAAEVEADASGYGFVAGFDESIFLGFGSDFVVVPDGQGGFAPFLPSNQTTQGIDNDQIAFIDLLHPTTAFHGILGYFQWASLTNEVTLNTLDGAADDTIGTTGNDVFFTSGGNDKIAARQGNDDLIGGLGDDFLIGNDGDDVLSGGTGDDRLIGGNNNDVLGGSDGDDVLNGGSGNDVLVGGLGSDRVIGAAGDDAFVYVQAEFLGGTTGSASDIYVGGAGNDTLVIVLDEATETLVQGEFRAGARVQLLDEIGLVTVDIENFTFLNSRGDIIDSITSSPSGAGADIETADLLGIL